MTSEIYSVLNPRGVQPPVTAIAPSPRLAKLQGAVIYCVSQHVRGTDVFVKKLVERLPEYVPGATVVYADKPDFFSTDVPELWDKIASKGSALIYAAAA
jgi:hypothetical protein